MCREGTLYCMLQHQDVTSSLFSLMSSFRSSGGKHPRDDLLIVPWERAGNCGHVEPPRASDQSHDLYGPSLRGEGSQRFHPKGATRGKDYSSATDFPHCLMLGYCVQAQQHKRVHQWNEKNYDTINYHNISNLSSSVSSSLAHLHHHIIIPSKTNMGVTAVAIGSLLVAKHRHVSAYRQAVTFTPIIWYIK